MEVKDLINLKEVNKAIHSITVTHQEVVDQQSILQASNSKITIKELKNLKIYSAWELI